jgi:hypothetical protein
MSDGPELHDFSRLDAHMSAVRRTALLHASWRPMLAGAIGAGLVIGAVALAMPRFAYREVEIPRITMHDTVVPNIVNKDVTVPNIITKDVEIDIPRIVPPSPLARTPAEKSFTSTEDWRAADVRGRMLRADRNGFVLVSEDGEEKAFYPARIGRGGQPENNPTVRDAVEGVLGDLAFCRPQPNGMFVCTALQADGAEVAIAQVPL